MTYLFMNMFSDIKCNVIHVLHVDGLHVDGSYLSLSSCLGTLSLNHL